MLRFTLARPHLLIFVLVPLLFTNVVSVMFYVLRVGCYVVRDTCCVVSNTFYVLCVMFYVNVTSWSNTRARMVVNQHQLSHQLTYESSIKNARK